MEITKRVIRNGNRIIMFKLDKKSVDELNKADHEGLTKIHAFILSDDEAENINTKSIRIISENARNRNIRMIIHCGDKHILNTVRKNLKGIPKDRFFHLSLMHSNSCIRFSDGTGRTLDIFNNGNIRINGRPL